MSAAPEIVILALALAACAVILVSFKIAYGCGYRQGASDAARQLCSFQRLKARECSPYQHSKN